MDGAEIRDGFPRGMLPCVKPITALNGFQSDVMITIIRPLNLMSIAIMIVIMKVGVKPKPYTVHPKSYNLNPKP